MAVDEIKIQRAIAELSRLGSSVRVTGYNRDAGVEAIDYTIRCLMERRRQLLAGAPGVQAETRRGVFAPRVEGEAGHEPNAVEPATQAAPAPLHSNSEDGAIASPPERAIAGAPRSSLPNSEDGAMRGAPARANGSAPRSSLPDDDVTGHQVNADEATATAPVTSSTASHGAVGHRTRAIQVATSSSPRPVGPSDLQKAVNRQVAADTMDAAAAIFDRRVRHGASVLRLGDVRYADLQDMIAGNARSAAEAGLNAALLDRMRQAWGRPYDRGQTAQDRFSAKELQSMAADLARCGAKVARTVARETRGRQELPPA